MEWQRNKYYRYYRYIKIVLRRKMSYFYFRYRVRFSGGFFFLLRLIRIAIKRRILSLHLRFLKRMQPFYRNKIVRHVFEIIQTSQDPNLLDRNAHLFALDTIKKTRWYHRSADLWLLYNSLPLADSELAKRILTYLKQQQRSLEKQKS